LRRLTKSLTFNFEWLELGLIRAEYSQKGQKTWFSRAEINTTWFLCTIANN